MYAVIEGGSSLQEILAETPFEGWEEGKFRALCESILIVIPHRAPDPIKTLDNFVLWQLLGARVARVEDPHGGFIEVLRNGTVRMFLDYRRQRPECQYMMMIDADEKMDWWVPMQLASHGLSVVTGVVCGHSPSRGLFGCFTVKHPSGAAYFPTQIHTGVLPDSGLAEVHQCGTGLLCVHHSVFETMLACQDIPFYIPEEIRRAASWSGDLNKSEDITFADLCEKYGIKRYVDFGARAIHYKYVGLSWFNDKDKREIARTVSVEDWINNYLQPHTVEGEQNGE